MTKRSISHHGVGNLIVHVEEEFHTTYPEYLNSKGGPKLSASDLEAMRTKTVAVSGLRDTYDKETKMIKICPLVSSEDSWNCSAYRKIENHVAFLTPFANTSGFTVLVPRRYLHSDVFRLDTISYNSLLHASFSVVGVLKN